MELSNEHATPEYLVPYSHARDPQHNRSPEVWKAMETQEIECCIRGYHVYQDIWEAAVDEELVCRPERSNAHDRYAVAVMKNDLVVGQLIVNHEVLLVQLGSHM